MGKTTGEQEQITCLWNAMETCRLLYCGGRLSLLSRRMICVLKAAGIAKRIQ